MGPTKEGGAREHHTATPHLPSTRLHLHTSTPTLAFLERETPAGCPPSELERETKEHRPSVRPSKAGEGEREKAVRRKEEAVGEEGDMERPAPVRKSHTSTADLLIWPEGAPQESPVGATPPSNRRPHQVSGPAGSPRSAPGVPTLLCHC